MPMPKGEQGISLSRRLVQTARIKSSRLAPLHRLPHRLKNQDKLTSISFPANDCVAMR